MLKVRVRIGEEWDVNQVPSNNVNKLLAHMIGKYNTYRSKYFNCIFLRLWSIAAGISPMPWATLLVMKSFSRGIPASLIAMPTSSSVPYISAQSKWWKPFLMAVLVNSTRLGLNWVLSSSLNHAVPVPKASYTAFQLGDNFVYDFLLYWNLPEVSCYHLGEVTLGYPWYGLE